MVRSAPSTGTGASGHHTDRVGRVAVKALETTLERGIRHQLW